MFWRNFSLIFWSAESIDLCGSNELTFAKKSLRNTEIQSFERSVIIFTLQKNSEIFPKFFHELRSTSLWHNWANWNIEFTQKVVLKQWECWRLGSGRSWRIQIGLRGSKRHLTACHDELKMLLKQDWVVILVESILNWKNVQVLFCLIFQKIMIFARNETWTSDRFIARLMHKFSIKPSAIEHVHRKLSSDTNKSKLPRQNQNLGCFFLRSNFAGTFWMVHPVSLVMLRDCLQVFKRCFL